MSPKYVHHAVKHIACFSSINYAPNEVGVSHYLRYGQKMVRIDCDIVGYLLIELKALVKAENIAARVACVTAKMNAENARENLRKLTAIRIFLVIEYQQGMQDICWE